MTITENPTNDHTPGLEAQSAEAFAERIFASALGMTEILSVYLGETLGWYAALASGGPLTAAELAARTSTDARYAREWLEQQAVVGILATEAGLAAAERRYSLPAPHAEVLLDSSSLAYLGPLGRLFVAPARRIDDLVEAYRTGGGVSWEQFGEDMLTAQADINRPWFEQRLAAELAAVPHLDEVLRRPGARAVEVGFGGGWASIALARAYPALVVDGYEVDEASVELARANAAEAGVADRVTFHLTRGEELPATGEADIAFAFECVHDMSHPVEVLAAVRGLLRPGAPLVVMDEAVAETFSAPGDDLERFMYGCSLFICLPDCRAHGPSAETGTVIRRSVLEGYGREAGFGSLDVLPIQDFGFWRFYELRD